MTDLRSLARPSGALAMVALDQRESLRTMVAQASGRPLDDVVDDELRAFKVETARLLTPHASAILLDLDLGVNPVLAAGALARSCALIVAADALLQVPGEPVEETGLDRRVDPATARAYGAAALKLLVLWRGDETRDHVLGTVGAFLRLCRAAGVLSVLEGVVRRPSDVDRWDREAAVVEAARELSALGPDLYKVEVPLHGRGDAGELRDRCAALDEAIGRPWVVLSQGVAIDDFPAAVEAACEAGASGFLAGRAVWSDSIGSSGERHGLRERLEAVAVPRLRALAELVDAVARPIPAPATPA